MAVTRYLFSISINSDSLKCEIYGLLKRAKVVSRLDFPLYSTSMLNLHVSNKRKF